MTAALEPELTSWDRRVLAALDCHHADRDLREHPIDYRTAWQVAEACLEEDVAFVRGTLQALKRFGYAGAIAGSFVPLARPRLVRWFATVRAEDVAA